MLNPIISADLLTTLCPPSQRRGARVYFINTLCGVGERNVVSGPGTSMATKSSKQQTRIRTMASGLSSNGASGGMKLGTSMATKSPKQPTRIRTMASGLGSNGANGGMKVTQNKIVDPFDDLKLEKVAPTTKNATKLNSAVASGND